MMVLSSMNEQQHSQHFHMAESGDGNAAIRQ